jgi:hypothetical protein
MNSMKTRGSLVLEREQANLALARPNLKRIEIELQV